MYNTVFRFIILRKFTNHVFSFLLFYDHTLLSVRLSHKVPLSKNTVSILKRGEYFCKPLYRSSSTESAEYAVTLPRRSSTMYFPSFFSFMFHQLGGVHPNKAASICYGDTCTHHRHDSSGSSVSRCLWPLHTKMCMFLLQLRYSGNLVHLILPVCVI